MTWNWQQEDWPHFRYNEEVLREVEDQFLKGSGLVLGAFAHLKTEEKTHLKVELLSTEALKTSEIEGEYLNRESLQSSIRRQLGLSTDNRKVSLAEHGIAEMMIDLVSHFHAPLTHEKLFAWHAMIMRGRQDIQIGDYRTHKDPMQIISGSLINPRVHFEAPPSQNVRGEMDRFMAWFEESATYNLSPVIRAGIVHLYFESIHPFEDGNGRIGRALSEKVLSYSRDDFALIPLSRTIEKNKKKYYEALERASRSNEITAWLLYFSTTILEAQKFTQTHILFLIEKTKYYDRFRGKLNPRQEKVLARMFEEGPEGFQGGMTAEKYISLTKTTRATATRDLQELVSLGAFTKIGERKHTRYYLNLG